MSRTNPGSSSIANDASDPPRTVLQAAHIQDEPPLLLFKENNTNTNQPKSPRPPGTPTPPPGSTNGTRAPEPIPLLERCQTALRHIHILESRNAKLYEDNSRLVNAVNMLNDRLALFGAPHNAQVLRLADMQERLRASETNLVSINRKYQELLHSISAGSAQHHVGVELQTLRDAYASLDREYHLLGDRYVRLKTLTDTGRVPQPQSQHTTRGLAPVVHSGAMQFRAPNQNWNDFTSPGSIVSPGSFQPSLDQRGDHRRRGSEGIMIQPSPRSGSTSVATTCLAPLTTPPPSASLAASRISRTGFGSLPLPHPHHAQVAQDPNTLSGPPTVTPPRHLAEQGTSEQPKAVVHFRQSFSGITDMANSESITCGKQISDSASLRSASCPSKRPNTELQTSTSPEGERKKPRTEAEVDCSAIDNIDTCPANKMQPSPTSTDRHSDHKLSVLGSDVRPYQDCVNLIFEKDADVEHGVFCGLCLVRYEAKMIPKPPDVLIQPDFDFLVRHCMTMHPTVWDHLQRKA